MQFCFAIMCSCYLGWPRSSPRWMRMSSLTDTSVISSALHDSSKSHLLCSTLLSMKKTIINYFPHTPISCPEWVRSHSAFSAQSDTGRTDTHICIVHAPPRRSWLYTTIIMRNASLAVKFHKQWQTWQLKLCFELESSCATSHRPPLVHSPTARWRQLPGRFDHSALRCTANGAALCFARKSALTRNLFNMVQPTAHNWFVFGTL